MPKRVSTHSLPPVERSLPIALTRARERVMAPIREMLTETGITEQQWRVLRVLAERGALTPSDLADRASLHQPSLTRILKTLGARGLIARSADAEDRRRQSLSLTPQGRAVIDDNTARAAEIAQALRDSLGPARFDTLLELLAKLETFDMPGND